MVHIKYIFFLQLIRISQKSYSYPNVIHDNEIAHSRANVYFPIRGRKGADREKQL